MRNGLQPDHLTIKLAGSAGQSLGAFGAPGLKIEVMGEANDYVGKGLCGAVDRGAPAARLAAGAARERHHRQHRALWRDRRVRSSPTAGPASGSACATPAPTVVVEGCGSNGCEYMTGGVAVILGRFGDNFGAGMTGGMAYLYDPEAEHALRLNGETVIVLPVAAQAWEAQLKGLIERHLAETGSPRAAEILRHWEEELPRFRQIVPKEMLTRLPHPLSDRGRRRGLSARAARAGPTGSGRETRALPARADGAMPNHPEFPVLLYRGVVEGSGEAAAGRSRRCSRGTAGRRSGADGIYDFHHYHTRGHEALGCAAGSARVLLGGPGGREVELAAGRRGGAAGRHRAPAAAGEPGLPGGRAPIRRGSAPTSAASRRRRRCSRGSAACRRRLPIRSGRRRRDGAVARQDAPMASACCETSTRRRRPPGCRRRCRRSGGCARAGSRSGRSGSGRTRSARTARARAAATWCTGWRMDRGRRRQRRLLVPARRRPAAGGRTIAARVGAPGGQARA